MPILSLTATQPAGLSSVLPSVIYINTNDTYATVTATGYLNQEKQNGATFNNQQMALVYTTDEGPVFLKVVISYSGATVLNTVVSLVAPDIEGGGVPFINTVPETSAAPGTVRSITGAISDSATVMTSGNLVGVRGSVNLVGASGGFLYGVQGKAIATGTLSGSSWTAGVFGQLDISGATINAGQVAPIWGDYGTTSGTLTNESGLYGIAMTNTTAAVLAGQIYLYGGATNLMLLNTNAGLSGTTYYKAAGVSAGSWGNATPPTPAFVLQISVNGILYYLPVVAQNT